MKFSTILAGLLASVALAAPTADNVLEKRGATCSSPVNRKEWRNLGVLEKSKFPPYRRPR